MGLFDLLRGNGEPFALPPWLRVVTGGALIAVATENWLGAREWQRYLNEAAAGGEDVRSAAVIPPPVSDEENFGAIPLFKPLFEYRRAPPPPGTSVGPIVWNNPAAKKRLLEPGVVAKTDANTSWVKGVAVDLTQWQERLRAAGFPETRPDTTPGADLLRALGVHEPDLTALRAAAARPHSRFPVRYDEQFPIEYPHLNAVLKYIAIARARALANLSLGDSEAAAADTALTFRIANSIHREPHLISHTMQTALASYAMQPLWEGVVNRRWNDAQLAILDDALARFDLLESYACAARGERSLSSVGVVEELKRHRDQLSQLVTRPNSPGGALIVRLIGNLLPSGTYDFNKALLARYCNRLLKTVDSSEHRVFVDEVIKLEDDFRREILADSLNPRKTLVRLFSFAFTTPLKATARTQTMVDLARVAIALERYRLRHGTLPSDLGSLTPICIEKLPIDVISGKSLLYRPRADGTYHLYGTGWNGRDDHGFGAIANEDRNDPATPDDWAWPALKSTRR